MSVEKNFEFIQKIRKFSDENIHTPGSKVDPQQANDFDPMVFSVVYANGVGADDKGYVSIDLEIFLSTLMLMYGYEISCFVNVIDASGSKRFPTSYVFISEKENALSSDNRFIIDRVFKRETLLREPEEFLPEDCLTLHYHIIAHIIVYLQRYYQRDSRPVYQPYVLSKGKYRLLLDSMLGKRLKEVSSCFRGLSEGPTAEMECGYVIIPSEDTAIFSMVCDILLGLKYIYFLSIERLFEIYVMADKYDVPVAIETCRCILSLLCRAAKKDGLIGVHIHDTILQFRKLTETRYDIRLKEIVDGFLKRNLDDNYNDNRTLECASDNPEAVWRLQEVGERCSYFVFARGAQDYTRYDFGFYQ